MTDKVKIPEDLQKRVDLIQYLKDRGVYSIDERSTLDLELKYIERIARSGARAEELEQTNLSLRDEFADFRNRLWCALGQPLHISYIDAARGVVAERDALKAENERLKADYELLRQQSTDVASAALNYLRRLSALKAENAALKAPVSDAEWYAMCFGMLFLPVECLLRDRINACFSARADVKHSSGHEDCPGCDENEARAEAARKQEG